IWHETAVRGVLQHDGKIIVATTEPGIQIYDNWVLTRLTTTGEVDGTFGTDGRVIDSEVSKAYVQDIELDEEGSIFVGGFIELDSGCASMAVVKKFEPDGGFDEFFSLTGSALHLDAGEGALAHAIALGSNGKIYLAGSKKTDADGKDFLLAAFESD